MIKQVRQMFVLIILTISIFLSGCNNPNSRTSTETSSTGENSSEVETPSLSDYYYDFEECIECSDEEIEEARTNAETIIRSLNNKETEKIKSVLTGVAIQDTKHLDEEIQCVFDMLDEEITKVEEYRWKTVKETIYKEDRCAIYIDYNIYTETRTYFFEVLYLPRNDTELDNVGVFSFAMGDLDREDWYYTYGAPVLNNIAGVFSSDKITIDYNTETLTNLFEEYLEDGLSGFRLPLQLNWVGIERIDEIEVQEVTEWNGLKMTLTDSIGNKYYLLTEEYGVNPDIWEDDENGKLILWFE